MSLDRIFEEHEPAGWQSLVGSLLGHAAGSVSEKWVGPEPLSRWRLRWAWRKREVRGRER